MLVQNRKKGGRGRKCRSFLLSKILVFNIVISGDLISLNKC